MALNYKPNYPHRYVLAPPKTDLTMQTAKEVYDKLIHYWAVKEYVNAPGEGWPRNGPIHRHLFRHDGFHHAVRWKPDLPEGWRRMTYEEFCNWYGLSEA